MTINIFYFLQMDPDLYAPPQPPTATNPRPLISFSTTGQEPKAHIEREMTLCWTMRCHSVYDIFLAAENIQNKQDCLKIKDQLEAALPYLTWDSEKLMIQDDIHDHGEGQIAQAMIRHHDKLCFLLRKRIFSYQLLEGYIHKMQLANFYEGIPRKVLDYSIEKQLAYTQQQVDCDKHQSCRSIKHMKNLENEKNRMREQSIWECFESSMKHKEGKLSKYEEERQLFFERQLEEMSKSLLEMKKTVINVYINPSSK